MSGKVFFLEYYLAREHKNEVIADILTHSARNILLFYQGNDLHAHHVAVLSASMFDGWQDIHNLGPRDKILLKVAALLHDTGVTINYYDHPRHSSYLIESARLFGLTHREQMLTAVVAGWHHGPSSKYVRNRLYNEFLDEADWQKARKLALLLALAESLDTSQAGLVERIAAVQQNNQAQLTLTAGDSVSIERQAAEKHRKWFRKEMGVDLVFVEDIVERI